MVDAAPAAGPIDGRLEAPALCPGPIGIGLDLTLGLVIFLSEILQSAVKHSETVYLILIMYMSICKTSKRLFAKGGFFAFKSFEPQALWQCEGPANSCAGLPVLGVQA